MGLSMVRRWGSLFFGCWFLRYRVDAVRHGDEIVGLVQATVQHKENRVKPPKPSFRGRARHPPTRFSLCLVFTPCAWEGARAVPVRQRHRPSQVRYYRSSARRSMCSSVR